LGTQTENPIAATLQAKFNHGLTLHQQGKLAEAERIYGEVLLEQPNHFDALHLLGIVAAQTQRTEQAVELLRRAIELNPSIPNAHNNLGNVLTELDDPVAALTSYDRAIALNPNYAVAHNNRGVALQDLDRPADALDSYDRAIALNPNYAEAYNNRGTALVDLNRPDNALDDYDKAIALNPNYAEAYNNRGTALLDLNRPADALDNYDKAVTLAPDQAEVHYNRGNALRDLKRHKTALATYDKAISLKPDYAEAFRSRGNVLRDLKRFEDAVASYDRAIAFEPDLADVEVLRLHTKLQICDWKNFDSECAHLISSVRDQSLIGPPFALLGLPLSSDDHLQCTKRFVANNFSLSVEPVWQGERYDNDRIRIAYLSADFRDHPGSYLIAGLLEQHDRSRFEIIGISFGEDDRSAIRKRVSTAFDKFYDVRTKGDREVAKLVRDLQVDIAIAPDGYTEGTRMGIFSYRPAPVQVSFLGYPATTGMQFIDYIIADKVVVPFEDEPFFTEKIIHLPDCYQANDSKRKISEFMPTRQASGLPEHGFVFCCFNNNYKIMPHVFDIWMRILRQVDGSVIWLMGTNRTASNNLRKEAAARGVNPDRLIFANQMSVADHLARHRLADLFLDTLPYNAHTTASDALWAGLPVLTCRGQTFAGRVAASLLNAIHLPELITTTLEDYERMAIELASNAEKLARIRRKLADNRLTTPLFDTKRFAKNIEAAYTAMYERHHAGLTPEHIVIT
jgi:predicted O-linked N-acetylglucosamine transferase (SPINDLY family)